MRPQEELRNSYGFANDVSDTTDADSDPAAGAGAASATSPNSFSLVTVALTRV
jgi:hypothetical protein